MNTVQKWHSALADTERIARNSTSGAPSIYDVLNREQSAFEKGIRDIHREARDSILKAIATSIVDSTVAAQQPGPAKTAKADSVSTPVQRTDWAGSSKGRTYYHAGCAGARKLAAKNLVYFKSEEDAKKAGYTRSRQRGC
jgi:hypothetical protein